MKQMARSWIFIISFLCFSCTQNKLPEDLIPRETFKAILADIQQYKLDKRDQKSVNDSVPLLEQTLNKYNISDSTYQKTLLFYAKNPEKMLKVVKEVEASFD